MVQFCPSIGDKSSFNTAQKQSVLYTLHILCSVTFLMSLPVADVEKACVKIIDEWGRKVAFDEEN